jgi:hypothetical protein
MVVNLPGTASLVVDEEPQLYSDVTQPTVSPAQATLCSKFWDYFHTVFPPTEQSTDSNTDVVFPCGST